jgi:hypothetical protein
MCARFFLRLLLSLWLCLPLLSWAGPVLIGGTDADDHGSATPTTNLGGWLYMQKVLETMAPKVKNAQKKAVCIGCNGSVASSAFHSAFDKSNLPGSGWTRIELTTVADINAFFADTGVHKTSNTGLIYFPSDANNVAAGLSASQLDAINLNANKLAEFVVTGGGLFTQTQQGFTQGYSWLKQLLPNLKVLDADIQTSNLLASTAMPLTFALDAPTLAAADQWHNYFDISQGGLHVLATGKATVGGTVSDVPVLLGSADLLQFLEIAPKQAPLPAWFNVVLGVLLLLLVQRRLRSRPTRHGA